MKIKVIAHTNNEEGMHSPGDILDMRDALAQEWIKKRWAIARPDLEPKREEPKREPEREPEPDPEPEPEPEQEPERPIETAAMEGAPEVALSARGRRGKRKHK